MHIMITDDLIHCYPSYTETNLSARLHDDDRKIRNWLKANATPLSSDVTFRYTQRAVTQETDEFERIEYVLSKTQHAMFLIKFGQE